jgi:hypothetical protein
MRRALLGVATVLFVLIGMGVGVDVGWGPPPGAEHVDAMGMAWMLLVGTADTGARVVLWVSLFVFGGVALVWVVLNVRLGGGAGSGPRLRVRRRRLSEPSTAVARGGRPAAETVVTAVTLPLTLTGAVVISDPFLRFGSMFLGALTASWYARGAHWYRRAREERAVRLLASLPLLPLVSLIHPAGTA